MSRTFQTFRASITVGALLMAFGALHTARAADAPAQRAEMGVAKAPVRRSQERTDSRDSDGSRFTYDSCGCSN